MPPVVYSRLKAKVLNGTEPIWKMYQKCYIDEIHNDIRASFTNSIVPNRTNQERFIIKGLKFLKHYDQYFGILNLPKMEFEDIGGMNSVLGYEKKLQNLRLQHSIIHDDYFPFFASMGAAATKILTQSVRGESLNSRYIINVPMKKANGKMVWMKQMSLALSFDQSGRIVRQLNSYTLVSQFDGVTLPIVPRIFDGSGRRALAAEQNLFNEFTKASLLELTPAEKRVLNAALAIYENRKKSTLDDLKLKELIKHKEIANFLAQRLGTRTPITETSVRGCVNNIRDKVRYSFNKKFPTTTDYALFFKSLQQLDPIIPL